MAHPLVYIGNSSTAQDRRYHREAGWYVLGSAYGPMLYANCSGLEEAFDEFDERHGERVNWEQDRDMLADYPGTTIEEQTTSAMECGEIRMNNGGTTVWVDHYEWVEGPFPTLSAALRYLGRTKL